MPGELIGIGVGPGDPDLITLKAVQVLQEIDVLYAPKAGPDKPSLALTIAAKHLPPGLRIEQEYFPMVKDKAQKEAQWDQIAGQISKELDQGYKVAFLTLGDPNTFSTFSYLEERLASSYSCQTIAGITSYAHIASLLGQAICLDDQAFCVIPASAPLELLESAIEQFPKVIVMKAARHLTTLARMLEEKGLLQTAVLVSEASLPGQKVYMGGNEWAGLEKASYFSTLMIHNPQAYLKEA